MEICDEEDNSSLDDQQIITNDSSSIFDEQPTRNSTNQ